MPPARNLRRCQARDKGEYYGLNYLSSSGVFTTISGRNEFAAVLRRKFNLEWEVIAEDVADVRTALDPVRPIDVVTHTEAVSLARTHRFSFHDSLIVASALETGCNTLLTEDLQTGRRVEGLTIVNPFA